MRFAFLAATILLSCSRRATTSSSPPASASSPSPHLSVEDAIASSVAEASDAVFAEIASAAGAGAAVSAIRDGKVVFEKSYGYADVAAKVPVDGHTRFLLASVTKPFTALCVLALVAAGRVHLDDGIRTYLPELPQYAAAITVRDLLQHTAGLVEYEDLFVERGLVAKEWWNAAKPASFEPTAKDAIRILASAPALQFPPGSRFEYSSSGYVVLAQLVERVSGVRFSDFLAKTIFRPAGMSESLLYDETRPAIPHVARSYMRENGALKEIDYTPFDLVYGEDNVYSSIEDMARWVSALDASPPIDRALLDLAQTPGRLASGESTHYGFGWFVSDSRGLRFFSHGGGWHGFRNVVIRSPANHAALVVLTSSAEFQLAAVDPIMTALLRDVAVVPAALTLPNDALARFVGSFESEIFGDQAAVVVDGDHLVVRRPRLPDARLVPIEPRRFTVQGDELATWTFREGDAGKIVGADLENAMGVLGWKRVEH